jgi:hypothetical protein
VAKCVVHRFLGYAKQVGRHGVVVHQDRVFAMERAPHTPNRLDIHGQILQGRLKSVGDQVHGTKASCEPPSLVRSLLREHPDLFGI